MYEIKLVFFFKKKQNKKNKDFHFTIQTISSSFELENWLFLYDGINSTSPELGLNLFKFPGWFICEAGWLLSSAKLSTPEKQHTKKLIHIFTTLINLIWICSQNANSN